MRIACTALLSKTVWDFSFKAAARPRGRTLHLQHSALTRSVSAVFLHTGHVCQTQTSLSITVTEEPDKLVQKLTLLFKGHNKAVLDSYEFFVSMAAKELGLTLAKVSEPPKNVERLTLLKSVHIFKKHRVQYEMRTHFRCIEISRVTGSTAQVYLEYIQRNLPEGVAMEVTKAAIEKIPEHIQKPLWGDQSQAKKSQ